MSSYIQKVMIVEDDPVLSLLEQRLVENFGYEVVCSVRSGEMAIEKLKSETPDFLIVDIGLQGRLTGIDLVKNLRQSGEKMPVIFLSGDNSQQQMAEEEEEFCVDFLLKPVDSHTFKKSLEKAALMARMTTAYVA